MCWWYPTCLEENTVRFNVRWTLYREGERRYKGQKKRNGRLLGHFWGGAIGRKGDLSEVLLGVPGAKQLLVDMGLWKLVSVSNEPRLRCQKREDETKVRRQPSPLQ